MHLFHDFLSFFINPEIVTQASCKEYFKLIKSLALVFQTESTDSIDEKSNLFVMICK